MTDEFEQGEPERKKIVIEDRRVISEKDAAEPTPTAAKKKHPKETKKTAERKDATPAGEGEELSEEEIAANIFDLGIERFIQYNLGVIIQFAYVYMGLVANPGTGLVTRDLARAKQSIDIFEYLAEKVKGGLMPAEAEELTRITKDLKLNFLNAASSRPPSAPPGGETPGG